MNPNTWSSGSLDKAVGRVKEAVAKRTGNEELEFRGKVQHLQGEAKEMFEDSKESVLKKANDWIDKLENN